MTLDPLTLTLILSLALILGYMLGRGEKIDLVMKAYKKGAADMHTAFSTELKTMNEERNNGDQ